MRWLNRILSEIARCLMWTAINMPTNVHGHFSGHYGTPYQCERWYAQFMNGPEQAKLDGHG